MTRPNGNQSLQLEYRLVSAEEVPLTYAIEIQGTSAIQIDSNGSASESVESMEASMVNQKREGLGHLP